MENQRPVICPENEDLALFMWKRRQEMAEPKGLSERSDMTIYKAYCSVCNSKAPIKTLKEFSQIKGVGKWILRLMKGFFETDLGDSEPEDLTQEGKETKGTKRYVPQKNSVAYALLITLYRGMANGSEFMRKQELIDAAEASGLSRVPIAPESGKGKSGQFGNSPRDWYSGWNAMKTLVTKGLVVKSSCPAKYDSHLHFYLWYMLSQQGQEAARDCLSRSGFTDELPSQAVRTASDLGVAHANSANKEKGRSKKKTCAFAGVSEVSQIKRSIPQPPVLCRLKKDQVHALHESKRSLGEDCVATSTTYTYRDSGQVDFVIKENSRMNFAYGDGQHGPESSCSADSAQSSFTLKTCSSSDYHMRKSNSDALEVKMNALTVPPLSFGERFEEVYDVILILDDREQFTNHRSRSSKIIENIRSHFKIQVEVRRLPVGDGIWIARHKYLDDEYVLDFIVERKGVHDLRLSIRDNRYKDQKLRLLRCGLKKLIYLVEGDPNSCEAAESIKTACFTTEILEGFDVQRTSGLGDTLRKYGFLTQAITHYYRTQFSVDKVKSTGICPSYDEFVKKCQDLEKMTVSDVFATQLMQVAQVTETVAVAVLDLYPTLLSLAHAYSLLDGDVRAQEEMLKKQSNNLICEAASRNIFQLVWGG